MVRRLTLIIALFCTLTFPANLTPGDKQTGNKEEKKLITSIALWYVEIRNIVGDSYNAIQYTKAMIYNLRKMEDWYHRNIKAWKDVGNKVVALASEPGDIISKLEDAESLFDDIDYQIFDESNNLDLLVNNVEFFSESAVNSANSAVHVDHPRSKAFLDKILRLYGLDPQNSINSFHFPGYEADEAIAMSQEKERLTDRESLLANNQDERVSKITHILVANSISKMASLREMQKSRAKNFKKLKDIMKGKAGTNMAALKENLFTLNETSNMLDENSLNLIEMELLANELGYHVYDLSIERGNAMAVRDGLETTIKAR